MYLQLLLTVLIVVFCLECCTRAWFRPMDAAPYCPASVHLTRSALLRALASSMLFISIFISVHSRSYLSTSLLNRGIASLSLAFSEPFGLLVLDSDVFSLHYFLLSSILLAS